MQTFSKDQLPADGWQQFQKIAATPMIRVDGEFTVDTGRHGVAHCEDGWLAVDRQGFPYPVAADEHEVTYGVEEEPSDKLARVVQGRHPDVVGVARLFAYGHLSERLQPVSRTFTVMAAGLVEHLPDGPDLVAALVKLVEAKDWAVRASPPITVPIG